MGDLDLKLCLVCEPCLCSFGSKHIMIIIIIIMSLIEFRFAEAADALYYVLV